MNTGVVRLKSDDSIGSKGANINLLRDRGDRHLFFDTDGLAAHSGVEIRVHEPHERDDFAMVYEEPWENVRSFGYNSVVDNGTHVLIYYVRRWILLLLRDSLATCRGLYLYVELCGSQVDYLPAVVDVAQQGVKSTWALPTGDYQNTYFTCLAVSADDGLTFTKPILNLIEINGSKMNNCVWPPGGAQAADHEPGTVFIDENPNARPDERYKMIVGRAPPVQQRP